MAKCNRCHKKGIFFKVNASGTCKDCERIEALEQEENRIRKEIEHLHFKYHEEESRHKKEIEALQAVYNKTEHSCNEIKKHRHAIYKKIAEQAKNDIKKEYADIVSLTDETQEKYDALQKKCGNSEKTIASNANKLLQLKTLVKSTQHSVNRLLNNDFLYVLMDMFRADDKDIGNYVNAAGISDYLEKKLAVEDNFITPILDQVDAILSTTVKMKLNLMDIRELRKRYSQNNKLVLELLKKYQSRYTTKANIAIYRLMVIALEAELQNILYNMKYSKLDKAVKDIKQMTAKYQAVASAGNQSIATTISKFIGEIEYLYIEAVKIEYEYYIQKERIKEEQKTLREQMRQEAAERKRLAEEQRRIEKEEEKYKNEIAEIERLITKEKDAEKIKLLEERKDSRRAELQGIENKKNDIINRMHGLAGSVYIISNLGSFGGDVFKIGMTRRFDPVERVDELGGASVPFRFDIHSVIFSQNAPELELKLHKQLHNMRLNKINLRKEFFRIDIDSLEEIVYSIEPTAEFNKTMLTEQYHQSMAVDEVPDSVSVLEDDEESDDDFDDTE